MEPSKPTTPTKPKSPATSKVRPSSKVSPTPTSGDSLAALQKLQARIVELENENADTKVDRDELDRLRTEVERLKATGTPPHERDNGEQPRKPLRAGWF